MFIRNIILSVCLLFGVTKSHGLSPELDFYLSDVGNLFNIDSCLLKAILIQEGGTNGEDTVHGDGSIDTGLGQIHKNGVWMKLLEKKFAITHKQLRDNSGVNIFGAGYALKTEFERTNDIFLAVSAYRKGYANRFSMTGLKYTSQVFKKYKKLVYTRSCPAKNTNNKEVT
jgi:hypothetical protein